jgi:hypothetical protein
MLVPFQTIAQSTSIEHIFSDLIDLLHLPIRLWMID